MDKDRQVVRPDYLFRNILMKEEEKPLSSVAQMHDTDTALFYCEHVPAVTTKRMMIMNVDI